MLNPTQLASLEAVHILGSHISLYKASHQAERWKEIDDSLILRAH